MMMLATVTAVAATRSVETVNVKADSYEDLVSRVQAACTEYYNEKGTTGQMNVRELKFKDEGKKHYVLYKNNTFPNVDVPGLYVSLCAVCVDKDKSWRRAEYGIVYDIYHKRALTIDDIFKEGALKNVKAGFPEKVTYLCVFDKSSIIYGCMYGGSDQTKVKTVKLLDAANRKTFSVKFNELIEKFGK